jgi:TRAP-type C4-dicarboxylate transport system permease large subunit
LILAFPQKMICRVDPFIVLTIPLLLLAVTLMDVGGITDRIIVFARAFVGHRKSGMSAVTVLSSMFIADISGSATAEASALGSILIASMKKQGMPPAYSASLVGISALLGPIIPPSITMIIFSALTGAPSATTSRPCHGQARRNGGPRSCARCRRWCCRQLSSSASKGEY